MDRIGIGKILKPQGIKGEVKVLPSMPDVLAECKAVYIDGIAEAVTVQRCSLRGGYAFLFLEGVYDRNKAETLRNRSLSVDRDQVPMQEGEHLHRDLLNCLVYDDSGMLLGKLVDVDNFGAADVYTVAAEDGVFRFPKIPALALTVDIPAKRITVNAARLAEVMVYED